MADVPDGTFEDDWFPFTWTTDSLSSTFTVSGTPTTEPYYAVIQSTTDGRVWNPAADPPALVTLVDADWAQYVIAMNNIAPNIYQAILPFSAIGEGQYVTRLFRRKTDTPIRTDPNVNNKFHTAKARYEPRSDGIKVNSDYGGANAMRVTEPTGHGIEGVEVMALKVINGTSYVRARTTSDVAGKWSFRAPLQPNTQHTITFEKAGFSFEPVTITTGGLS